MLAVESAGLLLLDRHAEHAAAPVAALNEFAAHAVGVPPSVGGGCVCEDGAIVPIYS